MDNRRLILKAAKKLERLCQSMLLFGRREAGMKINKQTAQREQLNLERARVEALTEFAYHLFRHKTVEIFDRREVGTGITASELNGSRHSL